MKLKTALIASTLFTLSALTMGCKSLSTADMLDYGSKAMDVATLSDADIKALSEKSCEQMDAQSKIAPANNRYTTRLNKIANQLGYSVDGTKVNYKVYLTADVNAWAMANGCVRVYSGLMDMMNDNEIIGVLGHELGHVALGHSKRAIQVAYSAEIARGAVAQSGGVAAALSSSQLGDLAEAVIKSQFSQKQESDADNYSFDLLVKKGINPMGLATAFEKLGGGEASLLSSHPSSDTRAKNIRNRIAKLNK